VLTQDFAFSLGRFFLHLVSVFPSSYRWAIVSAANSTPSERFGLLFSVQFLSRLSPEYSKINFSNILYVVVSLNICQVYQGFHSFVVDTNI
jgi:hypothetical protein